MKKHPNKDIRAAIEYALQHGWRQVDAGKSSHAFCKLLCGEGHSEHRMSVWSTPKYPLGMPSKLDAKSTSATASNGAARSQRCIGVS